MSRTQIFPSMLLLLIGATPALSQGLYVAAYGGYGLGAETQTIGMNYNAASGSPSASVVYGSYGEGLKAGGSVGYMFTENFGVELGFSYWFPNSIDYTLIYTSSTSSVKMTGSGVVAVPSLVISGGTNALNPYARVGLVLGIPDLKEEIRVVQASGTTQTSLQEKGGFPLGYTGALGINIPAGGSVDFFAEAVLTSLTYSPSSYEYTGYIVNGVDQLPTMQHKTIDYKETVSNTDQNATGAVRIPFSNVGFAAGVRIRL